MLSHFKFNIGQIVEVTRGSTTNDLVRIIGREAGNEFKTNWYKVSFLKDGEWSAFREEWLRRYVEPVQI